MRILAAAFLVFLPLVAAGGDDLRCGTGTHIPFVPPRSAVDRERAAAAPQPILRNGIAVVDAEGLVYGWKPFNLTGSAIVFDRVDASTFAVSTSAATTIADRGQELPKNVNPFYASYTLKNFAFPLLNTSLHDIFVSDLNTISDQPFPLDDVLQHTVFTATSFQGAMIAPLLTTHYDAPGTRRIFVSDTPDAVAITWLQNAYEIRATLYPSGRIRFDYVSAASPPRAGAVVVTSGRESWRSRIDVLADAFDPAHDVIDPSVPTAGMVDILEARVNRNAIGRTWIDITVADTIDLQRIPDGHELLYFCGSPATQVSLRATRTGVTPLNSPHATINGAVVTIDMPDDFINAGPGQEFDVTANVQDFDRPAQRITNSDGTSLRLRIPPAWGTAETDFRSFSGSLSDVPIVEAFTTGKLWDDGVWQRIAQQYALSANDWDAVAMYTVFDTDVDVDAGAWAVRGYPGDLGVYPPTPTKPLRSPTRLHMRRVGSNGLFALLHEFGHRWLFDVHFMDGGAENRDLCPDGSHPASWVNLPAAFGLYSASDCSVMGGGTWVDHHDGRFSTPNDMKPGGYSWLELYLMGLAAADETGGLFYIRNSDPPLRPAYNAGAPEIVTGTRRDVPMTDIVAVMGPRKPGSETARHTFRVAFVLVADMRSGIDASDVEWIAQQKLAFQTAFRTVTGGRGAVITDVAPPPAKTRAVRRRP